MRSEERFSGNNRFVKQKWAEQSPVKLKLLKKNSEGFPNNVIFLRYAQMDPLDSIVGFRDAFFLLEEGSFVA